MTDEKKRKKHAEWITVEVEPGWKSDDRHLGLNWSADGVGFGMLTFGIDETGVLHCDNECMGKAFCLSILETLTDGMSAADLPPLIRRYPSLEAMLDAAMPHNPGKGWE